MANKKCWMKVNICEHTYLLQIRENKDSTGYTCYLTDLVNLFKEETNKHEFSAKFNDFNKDLELDDIDEAFKELMNILNSSENKSKKIFGNMSEDSCSINVEWFSEGIPYKWRFDMSKQSNTEFHDVITKSILNGMSVLLEEREKLNNIIRSKDLEIEDYENGGAKLTRKALKTNWFNPEGDLIGIQPSVIEDEIEFFSSNLIQNVLSKKHNIDVSEDNIDSNLKDSTSNSNISTSKEKKVVIEKVNLKRKVVRPDLNKIADRMTNKRTKLSSL